MENSQIKSLFARALDNETLNKVKSFFKRKFTRKNVINFFAGSTTKKIFWIYLLILFIGSILLFLPISFRAFELEGFGGNQYNFTITNGVYSFNYWEPGAFRNQQQTVFNYTFLDALFSAFSAFSDTGLSVGATTQIFSKFGKVMLMFLIQIGGFGIMFFAFYIWKLLEMLGKKNKITINQTLLAQAERGTTKIGNTPKMLTITSLWILILELIYALIYSFWFLYVPAFEQELVAGNMFLTDRLDHYIDLYNNPDEAFFAGFFHSVSAVNNAGFDIIGSNSLAPYRNGVHSIFLFITITQFVIGGLGFPIIYDFLSRYKIDVIRKWTKSKYIRRITYFKIKRNRSHRTSLLTKISIVTYFAISLIGLVSAFAFECTFMGAGANNLWNDKSGAFGEAGTSLAQYNKSVNIIFQTFSARSAGFSTIRLEALNPSTKWWITFLMFVGGSPSSTAGGIRTTTIAVIMITVYTKLIGRFKPRAFRRTISEHDVVNAFVVGFFGLFIVSIGGIVVVSSLSNINSSSNQVDSFSNAMFLSASAFGTTGLSTNNIKDLDWYARIYLMFLMFVGQFGLSSTLLSLKRNKVNKNSFQYITERIKIG